MWRNLKKYEHFALPVYVFLSMYLVYNHWWLPIAKKVLFTLPAGWRSHFLYVSKNTQKDKKKNLHAAVYHHAGTSFAYAQCFKTASATEICACSIYYWPALTLQSPGKTPHRNFFPLLGCTAAAPLCAVRSWRIFKIKASCLSTILFLACHARPFSVWALWCSSSQEK